jgi:hypothetical protein
MNDAAHGPVKYTMLFVIVIGLAVALCYVAFSASKTSLSGKLTSFRPVVLDTTVEDRFQAVKLVIDPLEIPTNHNASAAHTCSTAWTTLTPSSVGDPETLWYQTLDSFAKGHPDAWNKNCNFIADPLDAHWEMSFETLPDMWIDNSSKTLVIRLQVEKLGMSLNSDCTPKQEALAPTYTDCVRAVFAAGCVFVYSGTGVLISSDSNYRCTSCAPLIG